MLVVFASQRLEPLSSSHRFLVVVSAKTTELLELTNPLLSLKILVSMAGLVLYMYFIVTPPRQIQNFLTAGLPNNHNWPNSVTRAH